MSKRMIWFLLFLSFNFAFAELPQKKVLFSITTCKRYDLFEKTLNSFLDCCQDASLIDSWLCVDDGSCKEDREKMEKNYPFFQFIWKEPADKGHPASMNIILERSKDYTYLLHMEDDFEFVEKRNFIKEAIEILEHDPSLGQVLFNRNYAEIDPGQMKIEGGFVKYTAKGLRYVEHEYYPDGSSAYKQFLEKHKDARTTAYWPHFSFRPSLQRVSTLQEIGRFYKTPHFEMKYAEEYVERGYKSAFLDTFSCIHIGRKTWERNQANAYTLNQTEQFSLNNDVLGIYILSSNIEAWKGFKDRAKLPYYYRFKLPRKMEWNDTRRRVFSSDQISLATQFDIWNYSSEYLLILDEDVTIKEDFLTLFNEVREMGCDFVSLSGEGNLRAVKELKEPIRAYILSHEAGQKLRLFGWNEGISGDFPDFLKRSGVSLYECSLLL